MTIQSTTKCEFCGKELKARIAPIVGLDVQFGFESCDCKASKALEAERTKAEKERKRLMEEERIARLYKRAGIPLRFANEENHFQKVMLEALESAAITDGLYIYGKVGRGKTSLACAIAKKLCREKNNVLFVSANTMLSKIKDTYSSDVSTDSTIEKYSSVQYLIIDDLGKETPTRDTLSILYRIIDTRWSNMKSTIVTSNYSRSELIERLAANDERETAESIVSRLASSYSYELSGEDRRIRTS